MGGGGRLKKGGDMCVHIAHSQCKAIVPPIKFKK